MKCRHVSGISALLMAAFATGLTFAASVEDSTVRSSLSPVTRVVQLLKGLAEKINAELKTEEELYESFVCWGQSVVSAKTESNAKATTRVDTLNTYITDLDAGRIELTTERADLEKQIKGLHAGLESAAAQRKSRNDDFLEAEEEMLKAIAALNSALEVLNVATEGHRPAELLAVKARANEAFSDKVAEGSALLHAVDLGRKFLGKRDALFLERLVTGEVPTYDWKKLNRKATFKMSYKSRSTKIIAILTKLRGTFEANLQDARNQETEEQTLYEKLSGSKQGELQSTQQSLQTLAKENGSRSLSRADASSEVESLDQQINNDKGYIQAVEQAMSTKKEDWKVRKDLRMEEIKAISEAIAILHSDDARDLFKRSLDSQHYLLMQVGDAAVAEHVRAKDAGAQIRVAAGVAQDARLKALAAQVVASPGHFEVVIQQIDNMIATLKSEEQTDLQTKEDCERDRAVDAREAAKFSREIDDATDLATSLKTQIREIEGQIKASEEEQLQIRDQDAKATKIRGEENKAWEATDADDIAAAELVAEAKRVLEAFYNNNGLMLAQAKGMQPMVEAGKAPPPPPATWEGNYMGKTVEAKGIIAILDMIHDDIMKDARKAKAEEADALAEYNKAHELFTQQDGQLSDQISELNGQKGTKEQAVIEAKESRRTTKDRLDAVLQKIKSAEPGCDYAAINYRVRASNRQIEIDGLIKAKAILNGAMFSTVDESRPLRPGDALLQRGGSRGAA